MSSIEAPFYDHSVKYDVSHIPKELVDIMKNLELADRENDYMKYDYYLPIFESSMKSAIIKHHISERDFEVLMDKYGGC